MFSRWQAPFAGPAQPAQAGDPALYFRREFTAADGVERATLHITALGVVEPYVNGVRVGDEVLAPGWTSYRHRLAVSSHDVTELIGVGANAVGAIVGEGWAVGRLSWEGHRNHFADRPAVTWQLEIAYADGTTELVTSDADVRIGAGAVRANSIYDGEDHDARLEPDGWNRPGFDDSGWAPAQPVDWPAEALFPQSAPPIRRIENLAPVEIVTSPSGKTIVDFGQNIAGWVRLTVTGEAGRTITLRHAEVLADGELATEPLRTAAATDRYTLRGGGEETWEPRFTFHGFRYVEVDGWPGDLRPDDLRAVVVHSDMTRTGWFESSHELINKLHDNVVWSMRGNFVGLPTDCPQRDERLGWTGDINAFAPTAAFLYDVRGVLGSWLADLAAEQREKGYVPWVVPDVLANPSPPTALWSDVAVSLPWTLYQHYGDLDILRAAYDSMAAFIRSVEALLDEHGLWSSGFQYGDWLDPDAPNDNPAGGKTDRHLVASAYLCKTTTELAQTAELLGHSDDAAHFAALAERVRAAFRREFVSASGRVTNESATAYALAICFGILDPQQEAYAGTRLAALVAKAGYTISTGFAGTPLVTDALTRTGHLEEAYLLLTETRCPSFLYPVTMGATTVWERWDSLRPDGTVNPSGMTSFNHYALGAVADWLHRVVGGLAPAEPGYRRMLIAPQPGGGLTHARVAHDTVHGRAEVAWRIVRGKMRLNVTIPDGTEADVILPLHPEGLREQIGAGDHQWVYDLPAGYGARPEYTMDTPLRPMVEDPPVWKALTEVFAKHFPGVPIDGNAPEAAVMSLNMILGYIPGVSDELVADLHAVLAAAAAAPPDELDGLTLEQKASLLSGHNMWATKAIDDADIASITLTDGPHGIRYQSGAGDHLGLYTSEPATCFPPAAAVGSSWDLDVAAQIGAALGREARALGVAVVLGPGINIKRTPLCGRNFEYYSEDPLLSGVLATAYVQALQEQGPGASVKHFAANNQETERMRISADVDERTLREIYLPAFERVVTQAQPATVMSAYNKINGVYASENAWLLTDVLRTEWGFTGAVVSDWGAVHDRVAALAAGTDLEMPGNGGHTDAQIVDAVRRGDLDGSIVDAAARRVLALTARAAQPTGQFDTAAHHALARQLAADCAVLLKNDGDVLPLDGRSRLAVVGAFATTPRYQGGGSSHINPTRVDSALDAITALAGERQQDVAYAPGFDLDGAADTEQLLADAVTAAQAADVAVIFAGLAEQHESEGFDRDTIDLPAEQVALIRAVAAAAPRTVVVLSHGGVVSLEGWHDDVDAIVDGWLLGQAGGAALADLLYGVTSPSGRLAETIPLRLADTPAYLNFPGETGHVRYGEGVMVGYRYYLSADRPVRYPFGHGLTYTTFTTDTLTVDVTGPDSSVARVNVTNTGPRPGKHVVQVYVATSAGPVLRPVRELRAFTKIALEPGESRTVELLLDRRAFAYYDVIAGDWAVAPGAYTVQVGDNVADIVAEVTVDLAGDQRSSELSLKSSVEEWFTHSVVGPILTETITAGLSEEQAQAAAANQDAMKMVASMPMGQFLSFTGIQLPDGALDQLIALSKQEQPA